MQDAKNGEKEKIIKKVLEIKKENLDVEETQAKIMRRAECYRKEHGILTEKDLLTVMTL